MTRVQGEHRFATCLDGVHPDRVVTNVSSMVDPHLGVVLLADPPV
jgi:hypothetical protein